MTSTRPSTDAGFTLIEVVVALVLFALIAVAGVALVDTILDVRQRTAGQLDRLADLERAMFVVTRDFEGIADAPLAGGPLGVGFDRRGSDGARVGVRYALAGTTLQRSQNGRRQVMLDRLATVRWSYYAVPGGWQDRWPANDVQARSWPLAVALDLGLAPGGGGMTGTLRRVVDLPTRPLPPGTVAP